MTRRRTWPDLPPVEALPVAPHRYTWTRQIDTSPQTWREVRDAAPYQPGEVVYTVDGDGFRRAYIVRVDCDRDRWGDLRECYKVRPETKAGTWARREYTIHPGYVQRGYQRAGMAPEMPESEAGR